MNWQGGGQRAKRLGRGIVQWLVTYAVMVGLAYFLQLRGDDWWVYFLPRHDLYDYPPLIHVLLFLIPSLPFLTGLTLTALLFCVQQRGGKWWHILAVFSALPLFWVLSLAQVDAVPTLGLACLPWGLPLVMLKPQVGIWYTWCWWRTRPDKWRIVAGVGLFLALTFVIWGPWPLQWRPPASASSFYNLSLWRLWWPLGALALVGAVLERDPDRAMALGALGIPYAQGASYFILLPALTRLRGWKLAVVWGASWLPGLVVFLGDAVRPVGALFPLVLWAMLAWEAWQRRENLWWLPEVWPVKRRQVETKVV